MTREWVDSVPFDLTQLVARKDSINPASGRSHGTGKSHPALERLIPPLQEPYKKITRQLMWHVFRKKIMKRRREEARAAKARGAPDQLAETSPANTSPLTSHRSKKARQPKAEADPSQPAPASRRKKLEDLCNGYQLLTGDEGLVIEDQRGVPLLVVVRGILPSNFNVCFL